MGGFEFILRICPNAFKNAPVEASLEAVFPDDTSVASVAVSCEISVLSEEMHFSHKFDEDFESDKLGKCFAKIVSIADADTIKGSTIFQANVFVEKLVHLEKKENNTDDYQTMMLCAQLNKLQDGFVSSFDKLYSNHSFFSANFCKKLEPEVSACHGGVGLPGAIAPRVPANILKTLRQNPPIVVATYRDGVQKALLQKIDKLVDRHFET